MNDYFLPKKNVEFEVYNFRIAHQNVDESIDEYYARLKQLAVNCEFGDMDREIKSQLIQTTKLTKLRTEGLCKSDINLVDLLKFGRTLETSITHNQTIEESLTKPGASVVHKIATQRQVPVGKFKGQHVKAYEFHNKQDKLKMCYNCGGEWPHKKSVLLTVKCVTGVDAEIIFQECARAKKSHSIHSIILSQLRRSLILRNIQLVTYKNQKVMLKVLLKANMINILCTP